MNSSLLASQGLSARLFAMVLVALLFGACRTAEPARGLESAPRLAPAPNVDEKAEGALTHRPLEDIWDLGLNTLSVGLVDVDWTVGPRYEGTRGLVQGHYAFQRDIEPATGKRPERENFNYLLDLRLEFGDDDVDVQSSLGKFTYLAWQETQPLEQAGKLRAVRDQLEVGTVIASQDDTLGLKYYYEIRALRGGRFWSFQPTEDSPFTITGSLSGSFGYVWAESKNTLYDSMQNWTIGVNPTIAVDHATLGRLYIDYRIVNGFDIGEPKGTFSREAGARTGYRVQLGKPCALDLFYEKRSFHVNAFDIPDLYTKTRILGFALVFGLP